MKSAGTTPKPGDSLKKCIFLDRDGTINKPNGFISKPEELELFEEAYEAIRRINSSDYLCIVITNQPVIARGDCTFGQLEDIHKKMERLLEEQGCHIDGLYYCPHHPDKGITGEVLEFKIECGCRKPEPGLFFEAQRDFNIDLSGSFMVGDSFRDVLGAERAGIKSFKIGGCDDRAKPDFYCESILEAVVSILQ